MCSFFAEPMALRRAAAHVAKVSLIGVSLPSSRGVELDRAFLRSRALSSSSLELSVELSISRARFPRSLSLSLRFSLSLFFFGISLFSRTLSVYFYYGFPHGRAETDPRQRFVSLCGTLESTKGLRSRILGSKASGAASWAGASS